MRIVKETLSKMQNISKPQIDFMTSYIPLLLSFQGKANFTNLSRYSPMNEKTIRRNYQKSFDFNTFNLELMSTQGFEPTTAAIDASFIPKSGKTTEGLAHFFNTSQGKAQKGLEVSLITLMDQSGHSLAVDAKQTIDLKDKSRLDSYLEQITGLSLPLSVKWVVADGFYSKVKFVEGVCRAGLNMVGKLRKDANLKYLFCGPTSPGPGRPKEYAGKVDFVDLSGFNGFGKLENGDEVFAQVVWQVQFKRRLKVVIVKGSKSYQVFFSTDLELHPYRILKMYQSRFQIEFFFRDGKQFGGLNDCQARNSKAIEFHFQASFSALNLAKIESQKLGHKTFSMQSIKTLHYNERLLKQFLFNSALKLSSNKFRAAFNKACQFGVIAS